MTMMCQGTKVYEKWNRLFIKIFKIILAAFCLKFSILKIADILSPIISQDIAIRYKR